MSDSSEDETNSNWVIVNPIVVAKEATSLDTNDDVKNNVRVDSNDSDSESDEFSIISEGSHLLENSSNGEEIFLNNKDDNTVVEDTVSNDDKVDADPSASETNSKWTYVETDKGLTESESSNKFYLNCMQEPIQELTERDFGSIQSDAESDGISIISDCESLPSHPEVPNNKVNEIKSLNLWNSWKENDLFQIKSYLNNKYVVGTVILATTAILLAQSFLSTDLFEDDLIIQNEEFSKDVSDELKSKGNYVDLNQLNLIEYCHEKHKKDHLYMDINVKKCINKMIQKNKYSHKRREIAADVKEFEIMKVLWKEVMDQKSNTNATYNNCPENRNNIKIKENYLKQKEKFLIKKEYELIKAELNIRKIQKDLLNSDEKNHKKITETEHYGVVEEDNEDSKNKKQEEFNKRKEKQKKKHHNESYKKYKKDEHYKQKQSSSHHDSKEKKHKHDNYKQKNYTTKFYKNNNKVDKKAHENNNKYKNFGPKFDKITTKKYKTKTNFILVENDKENRTNNGMWYSKMHDGRKDMRKIQPGMEQAYCRKWKRNKNNWYFKLMLNRENLRYKHRNAAFFYENNCAMF